MVGGDYNVLAMEAYKAVVGQQNFSKGAAIGLMLLLPAVLTSCWTAACAPARAQMSGRAQPRRGRTAGATRPSWRWPASWRR